MLRQAVCHGGIAGNGGGFVVAVAIHGLCAELLCQARDFFACRAVQNVQIAAVLAQGVLQGLYAAPDKGHAAVVVRQTVQDVGVEHKYRVDGVAVFQGVVSGGVVI